MDLPSKSTQMRGHRSIHRPHRSMCRWIGSMACEPESIDIAALLTVLPLPIPTSNRRACRGQRLRATAATD